MGVTKKMLHVGKLLGALSYGQESSLGWRVCRRRESCCDDGNSFLIWAVFVKEQTQSSI